MCAGTYAYSPQQTSDDDCNMQCSGDGSQTCGAGNRLQVYQTAATSAPAEHYVCAASQCAPHIPADVIRVHLRSRS
jgi:hypothetical protein